jgi:hypothetical protein
VLAKGGLGFVICREKDIDEHMSDIPQIKGMVLDSATVITERSGYFKKTTQCFTLILLETKTIEGRKISMSSSIDG